MTDSYRVQYGVSPSKGTSPWPWLVAVTAIVAVAGFFMIRDGDTAPPAESAATTTPPVIASPPATDSSAGTSLPLGIPEVATEMELLNFFPLGDQHVWQYESTTTHLGQETTGTQPVVFEVLEVDRTGPRPAYRCSLNSIELYYALAGTDLVASRTREELGIVQLRAPLEAGTEWESPEGASRCRIKRTNARVTVPLGEFTCLEVEKKKLDGTGSTETLYYAPGIGMVQQVSQLGISEKRTWSLTGYRLRGESYGSLATHGT